MMKKFVSIIWIVLLAMCPLFVMADDCSDALQEGIQEYNNGHYSKAKQLFEYVQSECGDTYGDANVWIQRCNEALRPKPTPSTPTPAPQTPTQSEAARIAVSKTYVTLAGMQDRYFVNIVSNRTWDVSYTANWFQVEKRTNGITIILLSDSVPERRTETILVTTSDGQASETITVYGAYMPTPAPTPAPTPVPDTPSVSISVTPHDIFAPAKGSTEYIKVTSNQDWDVIYYYSGGMYTATRMNDSIVKVVITPNTGTSQRQGYLDIKTKDRSKSVKITIFQSAKPSKSSPTKRTYTGYTALKNYNSSHGSLEVDWGSMRTLIGSGFEFELSLCALRYQVLKIEPGILGVRTDFTNGYTGFYYQPDIKLVFPCSSDWAVEFGGGVSLNMPVTKEYTTYYWPFGKTTQVKNYLYPKVWFTAELGVLYHWGEVCSSDFFFRYDGIYAVGVSINFSSGHLFPRPY